MKKILKYDDIKIHEEYYPRLFWSWRTSHKYSRSMIAGAKFPDIEVAIIDKEYWLIDGKHRLEAYKLNKEENIQVYVNKKIKTFEALYLEAVKKNVAHGRELSVRDRARIALTLKDMSISDSKISLILSTPTKDLNKFVASRVTNTVSGKPIYLQPRMEHLVDVEVQEDFEELQTSLNTNSQLDLIHQLIMLCEEKILDTDDVNVLSAIQDLKILLKDVN